MIYSMTAFGRGVHRTAEREVTAAIRSVNNRFLDCTVKLPRVYSFLEDKVKSYLSGRGVARGKVDVYIGVENLSSVNSAEITLDEDYTEAYIAALRELSRRFGLRTAYAHSFKSCRNAVGNYAFLFHNKRYGTRHESVGKKTCIFCKIARQAFYL